MVTKAKGSDVAGKVKFRVIEFELEGSDASLQESLKSLASALNRNNISQVSRQIRTVTAKQIEQDSDTNDSEVQIEPEAPEEAEIQVKQPRSMTPRKPAKIRTYSVLTNIRLDDVSPTFKEFAAEKNPSSDLAKYLVIAYWFKYHKKIPSITTEHFYTALRDASWKVPRDPSAPVRELRATRDQRLSEGSEPGTSMINQIGENFVAGLGKGA